MFNYLFFKKKSISPLIGVILLIVVVVSIIVITLSWGRSFTDDSLGITQEVVYDKSNIDGFIRQNERTPSNNVVLENLHSTTPIRIIGYKIHSLNDGYYLNKYLYLEDDFNISSVTINPNQIQILDLVCFPEREFDLEVVLEDGTYTTIKIKNNNFNFEDCLLSQDPFSFSFNYSLNQDSVTVTLSNVFEGSTIMYTLDGSTPSLENGFLYTGDFVIDQSLTFKVRSFKEGYKPTEVIEQYFFLCDNTSFDGFYQGDGSDTNPYGICNCQMLQNINNNLSASYILLSDIECSQTNTWNEGLGFLPIGADESNFNGKLDGDGFVVFNLNINRLESETQTSFFEVIGLEGEVKNIGFEDLNINAKSYSASLARENKGLIKNSFAKGSVESKPFTTFGSGWNYTQEGGTNSGGFVSINNGVIEDSYFQGTVKALKPCDMTMMGSVCRGSSNSGGFVSKNYGLINNSYFDGNLDVFSNSGGFVSKNEGYIYNSYSKGELSCNECAGFQGF